VLVAANKLVQQRPAAHQNCERKSSCVGSELLHWKQAILKKGPLFFKYAHTEGQLGAPVHAEIFQPIVRKFFSNNEQT
jgi:hypothetical protein